MIRIAIRIFDAQGRQVFGVDSLTAENLYRRGDRRFDLPGGLYAKLDADLPAADSTVANGVRETLTRTADTNPSRIRAICAKGARIFGNL